MNSRSVYELRVILVGLVSVIALTVIACLRPSQVSGLPEAQFLVKKLEAQKYDIVAVGDSRVLRGVSPDDLKSETYQTCLNFGFRSASLNSDYLRDALTRLDLESSSAIESSPPLMLIGVTPNAFTPSSLRDNGYLSAKKQVSSSWKNTPAWILRMEYALRPMSLTELMNLLRGETKRGHFEQLHSNGWAASHMVPINLMQSLPIYKVRFVTNQVSQEIVDQSLDFVADAAGKGVLVIGFEPPITDELYAVEQQYSGLDTQAYKQRFERNGGVWFQAKPSEFPTYDGGHLLPDSARELSRQIREFVELRLREAS